MTSRASRFSGPASRAGWWRFLAAKFGYSDSQIRTYAFNLAPFLANKDAIQQGYLGSEPFSIEQQAGFKPVVLLIADAGYPGYANIVTTSTPLAAANFGESGHPGHDDRYARAGEFVDVVERGHAAG